VNTESNKKETRNIQAGTNTSGQAEISGIEQATMVEDIEWANREEILERTAEGANKASIKKAARNKQAGINTSGQA
jgi:predicted ABC-type ATPase